MAISKRKSVKKLAEHIYVKKYWNDKLGSELVDEVSDARKRKNGKNTEKIKEMVANKEIDVNHEYNIQEKDPDDQEIPLGCTCT